MNRGIIINLIRVISRESYGRLRKLWTTSENVIDHSVKIWNLMVTNADWFCRLPHAVRKLYADICGRVRRLLVTVKVPSSLILVTLMMEVLYSAETSDLTRATRRNIAEDCIIHNHRRDNLKSYRENLLQIFLFRCSLWEMWRYFVGN
jgi:hypothetical protein